MLDTIRTIKKDLEGFLNQYFEIRISKLFLEVKLEYIRTKEIEELNKYFGKKCEIVGSKEKVIVRWSIWIKNVGNAYIAVKTKKINVNLLN